MNIREMIQNLNEAILAFENEENQIKERLSQIKTELANADEKAIEERTSEVENLEKRSKEICSLKEEKVKERDSLIEKEKSETEKANQEIQEIAQRKENQKMLTKRESQLTLLGIMLRDQKKKPFTMEEFKERALDTSLTTKATTFVQATANADGVNNGGKLIATRLVLDLLREDGALTPILNDVAPTFIKGAVAVPYRATRTKAQAKAEGSEVADAQWEWATLDLAIGKLQTQLVVTDELADMTEFDIGEYVMSQLELDFAEDWSYDLIYGSGSSNHISGITNGLTYGTYSAGGELGAIETAIKGLGAKYRNGAKLYVAQDVYDGIVFAKDSNSDYLMNPINNNVGVASVAKVPVEVDTNLKNGEFVFGNVTRYYKVNMLQEMRFETQRSATEGTTTYVVSQRAGGKAVPNAFTCGKKSV